MCTVADHCGTSKNKEAGEMSSSHGNLFLLLTLLLVFSEVASSSPAVPPIKAVNFGGWLVTEGWILPSLFDGIPNNDLLDGTMLQFKSVTQNRYLSADQQGGGAAIVANRAQASTWETFRLWRINETNFYIRVFNGQFLRVGGATIVATAAAPGPSETFQLVRRDGDKSRARIRAPNGQYLQAKSMDSVTADGSGSTDWGDADPSVFVVNYVGSLKGEYQICNGYGKAKATQVLTEHWNTYINESDFSFMSSSGLNAVRIPVGWWIASGPNPPAPFVGGSLQALDNAFTWAAKYKLGVIVCLHAAPGSQNPWEHSASRDGSQEWGTTNTTISQTVQVIDFLASRYANHSSSQAYWQSSYSMSHSHLECQLVDTLKKYYQAAYNAVRKYTTAYVIMSNRIAGNATELIDFAGGFSRTVIDVHYYNLFEDRFKGLTVQQNIDFVNYNRPSDINTITRQNGPLIFVGEWVAEWLVQGASVEDYRRFAQAQQNVYGRASFGWAYWTLENVNYPWSMEWMIKNGVIAVK